MASNSGRFPLCGDVTESSDTDSITESSESDSDYEMAVNHSSSGDEQKDKVKTKKRRKRRGNQTKFYTKRNAKEKDTPGTCTSRKIESDVDSEERHSDEDLEDNDFEDCFLEDHFLEDHELESETSDDEALLAEVLNFLRTEDLECETDVKEAIKKRSRYQEKLDEGDAYFKAHKNEIITSYLESQFVIATKLCAFCKNDSSIFCKTCGSVCFHCDIQKHCVKPLHSRFFAGKPLAPGVTVLVGEQEYLQYDLITPINETLVKTCGNCSSTMEICASQSLQTIVNLENSCVCKKPIYKCVQCQEMKPPTLTDYLKSGMYPLNGDVNSSTVATISVLEFWSHLKNLSPKCGLSSFIATLTKTGFAFLNQQSFDKIYCQYNNVKYTVESELFEDTPFKCPAINSKTHRPHLDGDAKLINFTATHQTSSRGSLYYGDAFIGDDVQLISLIEQFKKHGFVSKSDAQCGSSKWTAGKNSQSRTPTLDAKGLQVCCCEHYFYLCGLNQPTGELFCLNALLVKKLVELGYNFDQIELDISCLFSKWYKRLKNCTELLEELGFHWKDVDTLIGDFHSQGHSLFCRIIFGCLWSGYGRPSGGEMMEVLNAPLSLLRDKTRFMKLDRRNEEISEKVAYDNTNRSEVIVPTLVKKREKFKSELRSVSDELFILEGKIKQEITRKDINDVKDAAGTVINKEFSELEERIEFLVFAFMHKKRQLKTSVDNRMIAILRRNLTSAQSNLFKAMGEYNEINDEKLDLDDIQKGIFPWQRKFFKDNYRNENPMEFLKACELFLKKENTVVEMEIIKQDIMCVIEKRLEQIRQLKLKSENESVLNQIALKNKVNSLIQRLLRDKESISGVQELKYMEDLISFDCQIFPCELPEFDRTELSIENTNMPLEDSDLESINSIDEERESVSRENLK